MKNALKSILACAGLAILPGSSFALQIGPDNLIGIVSEGSNSESGETADLQFFVTEYNGGAGNGDLTGGPTGGDTYTLAVGSAVPLAPNLPSLVTFSTKDEDSPYVITLGGADYMALKLGDGGQTTSKETWYFYVGDLVDDGDVDINWTTLKIDNAGRLSHVTLFNQGGSTLPDGGATAALLGMALLGVGGARRLLARKA